MVGRNYQQESWYGELTPQTKEIVSQLITAQRIQGDMEELLPVEFMSNDTELEDEETKGENKFDQ